MAGGLGGCRFVNDVLHVGKRIKDLFRRAPVERTHGEVVVFELPDSKLRPEVLERIKLVRRVEILIILAMAALDLSVMPRREDFNELMSDTELFERFLKECRPHRFGAVHPVRELRAVVGLHAFYRVRELFHAMADELGGRIGSVILERLEVAKSAVFVDERELVIEAAVLRRVADRITDQAGLRDVFYVDLHSLAGVLHLLIGLGNVFRIRQLDRHLTLFS